MRARTNWTVITGGPSSGKTTTIGILRRRGFTTTIEHARHFIDTMRVTGKSVAEIRSNQMAFQRGVMEMQIEQERMLDPAKLVFLDRALPDGLAYHRYLGLTVAPEYLSAIHPGVYRAVFVMDLLPLKADYARSEDQVAQKEIHRLLVEVYLELGYQPVAVPPLAPEARVDFILAALAADETRSDAGGQDPRTAAPGQIGPAQQGPGGRILR